MEKYSIKINKTAENGEKTFVIQQYRVKDALQRYEDKMKRYRLNCMRKEKKANNLAEREAKLFEIVEETIEKKVKIVTSKPNPSKGTKTDIVFEWTPEAKAAKAELANQKITKQIEYTTRDGNATRTRTVRKVRTAKDCVFTPKVVKEYVLPSRKDRKNMKLIALENRQFSDLHNKLITNAFSGTNNRLKQAAEQSAHENKIQKLMKELQERKHSKMKYRFEFRKFNHEHKPFMYLKQYSNKKLEYLYDTLKRLAKKCTESIEDFICINIYDNQTDNLLKVCTSFEASDIDYQIKLKELKNLYPDYYKSEAA